MTKHVLVCCRLCFIVLKHLAQDSYCAQRTCGLCDGYAARGWSGEAGYELQQRGLSCAAAPIDEPQLLCRYSEGDVLQQRPLSACMRSLEMGAPKKPLGITYQTLYEERTGQTFSHYTHASCLIQQVALQRCLALG